MLKVDEVDYYAIAEQALKGTNGKQIVCVNPNYCLVDGAILEIGVFDNPKDLALELEKVSKYINSKDSINGIWDICWLDVFDYSEEPN